MKKRLLSVTLAMLLGMTMVGCGSQSGKDAYTVSYENISTEPVEESVAEPDKGNANNTENSVPVTDNKKAETIEVNVSEAGTVNTIQAEETDTRELTFADLATRRFTFSSGAGAWSEDFTIEKDGYFTGQFHDADMGVTGEGYPEGTAYSSRYSGHFADINKVNDYTYTMKLEDISYRETPGTEEIDGERRYIYTDSYCLGGTDTFTVYLPGTPISELSEEVCIWLYLDSKDTELTEMVIVDETNGYGIASYDRMTPLEEAQMTYDNYKASYDYYGDLLSEAGTTVEMVEYTGRMYELSDTCLNEIWRLVRYNVDVTEFDAILEEQRAWITEKEAAAQRALENDGSFAAVDYNDIQATSTMERCGELIEYLK